MDVPLFLASVRYLTALRMVFIFLADIAGEKAGIIKPGVPVIIGEDLPETRPVFQQKAQKENSPIIFAQDENQQEVQKAEHINGKMEYTTRTWGKLTGELCGDYQAKNMNTILNAVSSVTWEIPYLMDVPLFLASVRYLTALRMVFIFLADIAGEKAGIIKPGVPVIIGEDLPETRPVFQQKAQKENSPIIFACDVSQSVA